MTSVPHKTRIAPEGAALRCDVLVVGSGIAGVSAALAAADIGARVDLVCSGALFGGSSFRGDTWGLGLICPSEDGDAADLVDTILRTGRGMADETLVRTLVEGIPRALSDLEASGVDVLVPEHPRQESYRACFDTHVRTWRGLTQSGLRRGWTAALVAAGVTVHDSCDLVDLRCCGGRVVGATVRAGDTVSAVDASAVVLATGGVAGLFASYLGCATECGVGHAAALRAGARLVNMEFLQIVPAYRRSGTAAVFDERLFRHARLADDGGRDLLAAVPDASRLLQSRSTHAPFSCSYDDAAVDVAVQAAGSAARMTLDASAFSEPEEFVATYLRWLRDVAGVDPALAQPFGLCAHAENGGIAIDADGFTGVPGLYAAGECAGGVHGADRLGGLASAAALVFGGRAGRAAALGTDGSATVGADGSVDVDRTPVQSDAARSFRQRQMMDDALLVSRTAAGLSSIERDHDDLCARAMAAAAAARRESRGAHRRDDYPAVDPRADRPNLVRLDGDRLTVEPRS